MILVLGATGFLGKNLCRELERLNYSFVKSSLSLGVDLLDIGQTDELFQTVKPKIIINCAAFVGGIEYGYKYPVELFTKNIRMISNVYDSAMKSGVKKIINPISNCAYPSNETLYKEENFWNGYIHESVLSYGFTRRAVVVISKAFDKQYGLKSVNLVMSNMYGPYDHFDESRSHALGALIMKIDKAKSKNTKLVEVWGDGSPVREWLYVNDAVRFLVEAIDIETQDELINIGQSKGISIFDLANSIAEILGYNGQLSFDTSKPNGAPFKTVDGTLSKKYFSNQQFTDLKIGIRETYDWYNENYERD
jgi:GDP-L-fucose synthase